jgi:hypothetical protein
MSIEATPDSEFARIFAPRFGHGIVRRMGEPPRELDGATVLKYAVVTPKVKPTGATRHWVDGISFGPAAALAIVRYAGCVRVPRLDVE